jgi:hypothetical protein
MNERIKELAKAHLVRDEYTESGWQECHKYSFDEDELEEFAQLIVAECITIVDEQKECLHEEQQYWHDRDYGYALAVDDASKGIKQFFGVEE